jgi:hypothetical protein
VVEIHSCLRRDVRETRGRGRQIESVDDESLEGRPVEQCGDNELADARALRLVPSEDDDQHAEHEHVNSRMVSVTCGRRGWRAARP